MSQTQVAINAAAARTLAEWLTGLGVAGDTQAQAEEIIRRLLADGLAPVLRPEPIPARGSGGSQTARAAALEATAKAVADAKARRERQAASEPAASPRQLTKLAILLSEDGVKDRQERLDWCSAMVDRELTSSSELTHNEAHRLIESLEAPPVADDPIRPDREDDAGNPVAVDPEDDDEDLPPGPDEDDATGDFEDEYRADQQTWAEADETDQYVYAGDPGGPPF